MKLQILTQPILAPAGGTVIIIICYLKVNLHNRVNLDHKGEHTVCKLSDHPSVPSSVKDPMTLKISLF